MHPSGAESSGLAFLFMALCASAAFAQETPPSEPAATYHFVVLDSSPRLFTMRQIDQDYVSGYRLWTRAIHARMNPAVGVLVDALTSVIFFETTTHEEGHRSILREEHIPSTSRPFFFMTRSGYVDGVTDQTLKTLRDTRLPTFIRLHTAGFESDYMLAAREETLLSFNEAKYRDVAVDLLLRKYALVSYLTEGVFKRDSDGPEEADELQRDIVGNDLYGAIRHLYRPTMEYRRYTRFADLTDEEHQYLRRIQWRTLLNLANPNVIGISHAHVTSGLTMNAGLGHCVGPFGDFIDEKIWLEHRRTLRLTVYVREFENRDRWFFGAGVGLDQYQLTSRLSVSAVVHYWDQPLDLGFTTRSSKSGGAIDLTGSYRLTMGQGPLRHFSLDAGVIAKTPGFLPEEVALGRRVGFRIGLSLVRD